MIRLSKTINQCVAILCALHRKAPISTLLHNTKQQKRNNKSKHSSFIYEFILERSMGKYDVDRGKLLPQNIYSITSTHGIRAKDFI